MKNIILILIIISLIVSTGLFIKPKKADAIFGDILIAIKEWVVDALPKTIARHFMVRLQQEITRWAQGGFSDDNKPFAMFSWKEELKDAFNLATGKFIQEFNLTPLCFNFNIAIGQYLGLTRTGGYIYQEYAACTIETIVGNAKEFWENPSISIYGWDTWTALARPENNIFGSVLLAAKRKAELEDEEVAQKVLEKDTGSGYRSENECVREQGSEQWMDQCEDTMLECSRACGEDSEDCQTICGDKYYDCISRAKDFDTGICLQYKTKNLGSTIHSAVEGALNMDLDWLISAEEITEMFNIVFSSLFSKVLYGGGLNPPILSKYQSNYAYYDSFKEIQTPEDIKKLRTDILQSTLDAIKRIAAASYTCEKLEQLKEDMILEVAMDILDQESQHLYTGMEGINLKPDFIVLDSWAAVENNLAIYGQTWNDIPFRRYPPKCEEIAGKECKNIVTGLPYELELDNINSECTTGCLSKIYDYLGECNNNLRTCLNECNPDDQDCENACYATYPNCNNDSINKAVANGKCSSFTAGNACFQGAGLIVNTKNTCNECIKKTENQCKGLTGSKKINCIELHCDNYQNIDPSIIDANDFYERCNLFETKKSCNICLKEYFMPAAYCGEVADFINRSFIKYPVQVYYNMWLGGTTLYDCANGGDNQDTNRTDPNATIPIHLICRINPEYRFTDNATGQTTYCSTYCDVSEAELKDITDNKPTSEDCSGQEADLSAYNPMGAIIRNSVRKYSKCCPALTGHDSALYKKCRGMTKDRIETEVCDWGIPPEEEPWCYCDGGYRPLGFTRTGGDEKGDRGGDCSDFTFESTGETVYGYTSNQPRGDVVYIGNNACQEGQPGEQWDATAPSDVIWESETPIADTPEIYRNINLSGQSGTLHSGVYHNDSNDEGTGWHLCAPCNPSDANYPNYGTNSNQCTGKKI